MSHGPPLPATHVAVRQVGADLISSFVFDDGLADARGVAVVMTPGTIRAVIDMFEGIKRSRVLEQPAASELLGPPSKRYVAHGDPISAHTASIVVAEDSGVVIMGFRYVDLAKTLADKSEHQRVPIQTTPASSLVALNIPTFLKWVSVLEQHLASGDDNGARK